MATPTRQHVSVRMKTEQLDALAHELNTDRSVVLRRAVGLVLADPALTARLRADLQRSTTT